MGRYSADPFRPIFEFSPRSRASRLDNLRELPSAHPIRTKDMPSDCFPSNPINHQPIPQVCNDTSGKADTKPDPNGYAGQYVL